MTKPEPTPLVIGRVYPATWAATAIPTPGVALQIGGPVQRTYTQAEVDALVAQAVAQARKACETALRVAREGYASEAITGLPVLPQWRERTIALIDEALSARTQGGGNHG